jgi:hypothetical protein
VEAQSQIFSKFSVAYACMLQHQEDSSRGILCDEHVSQDNTFGIIDRFVRIYEEMIDRYRTAVSKRTSFSAILDQIDITCNSQPHRTIEKTCNEMYDDIDKQKFNFEKDIEHKRNVLNKIIFIFFGAEAGILEKQN